MRRFRKATIKDVAQMAGVSTTTVSYFVKGRDTVCSPETAERIRSAIDALQYTPSSLTSGLRQQQTTTVGICTAHPLDAEIAFAVPYFERLVRGIMYQADIERYALLRFPADYRASYNSDVFLDGRVDGMILDPMHSRHAPRMLQAGMPTVVVTRCLQLPPGAGGAFADERMTVDLALSHLWHLGHRRIAHLAGPTTPTQEEADDVAVGRANAFANWLTARGSFDPALVASSDSWQWLTDTSVISRWRSLAEPPTAVFCANDTLALHLIQLAEAVGWRIPDQLSVVGVDNFANAVQGPLPLTTVDVPVDIIGREAVRNLVALIHGAPVEQCRSCIPVTHIVVRASTAPVAV